MYIHKSEMVSSWELFEQLEQKEREKSASERHEKQTALVDPDKDIYECDSFASMDSADALNEIGRGQSPSDRQNAPYNRVIIAAVRKAAEKINASEGRNNKE